MYIWIVVDGPEQDLLDYAMRQQKAINWLEMQNDDIKRYYAEWAEKNFDFDYEVNNKYFIINHSGINITILSANFVKVWKFPSFHQRKVHLYKKKCCYLSAGSPSCQSVWKAINHVNTQKTRNGFSCYLIWKQDHINEWCQSFQLNMAIMRIIFYWKSDCHNDCTGSCV